MTESYFYRHFINFNPQFEDNLDIPPLILFLQLFSTISSRRYFLWLVNSKWQLRQFRKSRLQYCRDGPKKTLLPYSEKSAFIYYFFIIPCESSFKIPKCSSSQLCKYQILIVFLNTKFYFYYLSQRKSTGQLVNCCAHLGVQLSRKLKTNSSSPRQQFFTWTR